MQDPAGLVEVRSGRGQFRQFQIDLDPVRALQHPAEIGIGARESEAAAIPPACEVDLIVLRIVAHHLVDDPVGLIRLLERPAEQVGSTLNRLDSLGSTVLDGSLV